MKTAASDRPLILSWSGRAATSRGDSSCRRCSVSTTRANCRASSCCSVSVTVRAVIRTSPIIVMRVSAQALHYLRADLDDADSYARLKQALDERALTWSQPPDYVFYMATPPSLFARIARGLAAV